ncbi:glycoside hydrolase family 92 protein [Fulvivirga sp. M361]|uniref:GH92 family glycosyl hydrolase n=1 Tax=Fulvivirga sp. M361 TaxID=2594266 RepID=UPI00117A87E3|nr:GH92 family glycosyl hydrolase [Fulvivirga sp. M361]TRX58415.1 glycoside hydrolase family 92 protein [Fulvivirga sp. M361]
MKKSFFPTYSRRLFSAFVVPLLCIVSHTRAQSVVHYADPLIGSEGGGHVFVGACLPFGMVKLGPDMVGHSNSGYRSDSPIEGLSHTHVSGTGGGAKYGNISVMPASGSIDLTDYTSGWNNEKNTPGYFSVQLDKPKVQAELTATHSVGFHRYTFEGNSGHILIEAGHFLFTGSEYGHGPFGEAQQLVGSEIKVLSNTQAEGYVRVRGGWNYGEAYTVYFYAQLNQPASAVGTWKGTEKHAGNRLEYDTGEKTGAWFSFSALKQKQVMVKVGISFVSTNKAKANLQKEINHWDFDKIKTKAEVTWNDALSRIIIEGKKSLKTIFYTGLYHSMLMPVDRTGENPLWKSDKAYYDDYYAIWDTFRTTNPLLLLIMQDRHIAMLESLLDIYKHEGYMPDARSGNSNGRTQGGSNCDILFAEAFLKELEGLDYQLALEAMLKNAEVPPGGNEQQAGRGGLRDYNSIGYVSYDFERSGSRTMEYANCDYAIATLAEGLGKKQIAETYYSKSSNWKNLWRDDYEDRDTKGFIYPRLANGDWIPEYDFMEYGYWPVKFYEGRSWNYSFYVPHDVRALVDRSGGKDLFLKRLDTFFAEGLYDVGNEPDFLTPAWYSYVGEYPQTAQRTHAIMKDNFTTMRDGLPGNDDSGAMSSWYIFHAMGFYPVAGQDVYLVTSPLITHAVMDIGPDKKLEIEVKNASAKNMYVTSMTINGEVWEKAWFQHKDIAQGGKITFTMGSKPSDWGKSIVPPSNSDRQ